MRLLPIIAAFFILAYAPTFGSEHTFILQDVDTNEFLIVEGDTSTQLSPYCSFNIALSLMGFETEILQDTENPLRPFKEEYKTWIEPFQERWAAPHNPTSWIKNSCVWYSQVLTKTLGMKAFTDYIKAFEYGNQNLSGDAGKANGLTNAWIGSSLRITPMEQALFINKLVKQELPVSARAHELTKAILFVEELPDGMRLYGKTGGGYHGKGQDTDWKVGWFVGWIEKGNRRLAFVYMVQASKPDEPTIVIAPKDQLKQRLLELPL